MEPEPMAYVALAPCGCTKFAGVDVPANRETLSEEIAASIKAGYRIERVTCAWVRENFRNTCATCKPAEQGVLDL